jgi:hypothetical protein
MAREFKEVASIRTDLNKYGEGYDRIFGKKNSTEVESEPDRESSKEEALEIKKIARESYRENSGEQGSEGFPESSSFIYGFIQGYQAAKKGR